jgi:GNAT superfamily N-acetyltransferase
MNLQVRHAKAEDIETVESILEEARAWLHGRRVRQWLLPYPKSELVKDIARGEVYLAWIGNEPAGTMTLQPSDEVIWGEASDDALYIHRLAVRRKFAGREVGWQLLSWAEEAAASAGKCFLRLDCWGGNRRLCEYYRETGFESRGERWIEASFCRVHLFEKAVSLS